MIQAKKKISSEGNREKHEKEEVVACRERKKWWWQREKIKSRKTKTNIDINGYEREGGTVEKSIYKVIGKCKFCGRHCSG